MFFISKILGTQYFKKEEISFISSLDITDTQKKQLTLDVFSYSKPFKVIQRLIAISISLLYIFSITIVSVLSKFYDMSTVINLYSTLSFGMVMLTILGFYFSGGAIESFRNLKKP